MPLDARKAQHIQQVTTSSFAGRQRGVVFVTQANGSYSYTLMQVIMRSVSSLDPQIFDKMGRVLPKDFDAILIAPSGISMTGVVYIADTTTATTSAVAVAPRYEIVEILTAGMVPGGSRVHVLLRRMR